MSLTLNILEKNNVLFILNISPSLTILEYDILLHMIRILEFSIGYEIILNN